MKIKNIAIYAAAIAATLAGANNASAAFNVQMTSTISDSVDTLAVRLWNNAGFTSASQTGDPVWLVIDADGDGIWAAGTPGNVSFDGTQAGLRSALIDADDFVYFTAVPGPIAGRIAAPVAGIDTSLQTGGSGANDLGGTVKPSYALLFDDANFSTGATFGFNAMTAGGPIPNTGNVILRIGENTAADTYAASVATTVIPEPITGVAAALALGGLALIRRRGAARA